MFKVGQRVCRKPGVVTTPRWDNWLASGEKAFLVVRKVEYTGFYAERSDCRWTFENFIPALTKPLVAEDWL